VLARSEPALGPEVSAQHRVDTIRAVEPLLLLTTVLVGGFVFGWIARLIVPGEAPLSWSETVIVGVVGAGLGATAVNLMVGGNSLTDFTFLTILGSVAGSVVVLLIATWLARRYGWRTEPEPTPASASDLIAAGETSNVEFKETARVNTHTGRRDDKIELAVAKTIAGFLNAEGGTLLIGVGDDGTVVGLDRNLAVMKAADVDRYQLWLTDHMQTSLGKNAVTFVTVTFEAAGPAGAGAAEVCRVEVGPADMPIFLNEPKGPRTADFYLRLGNSTRRLLTDEVLEYQARRWPT